MDDDPDDNVCLCAEMTEEVEVFCDYCAKLFKVSRACYDAHDTWFCSEKCEADADMALAQEMLRANEAILVTQ